MNVPGRLFARCGRFSSPVAQAAQRVFKSGPVYAEVGSLVTFNVEVSHGWDSPSWRTLRLSLDGVLGTGHA
jgi:hypothetical protein